MENKYLEDLMYKANDTVVFSSIAYDYLDRYADMTKEIKTFDDYAKLGYQVESDLKKLTYLINMINFTASEIDEEIENYLKSDAESN